MKEFNLVSVVTVTAYTTVVANSLEEAISKSDRRSIVYNGDPCTENECWLVDEFDGIPCSIREEDE